MMKVEVLKALIERIKTEDPNRELDAAITAAVIHHDMKFEIKDRGGWLLEVNPKEGFKPLVIQSLLVTTDIEAAASLKSSNMHWTVSDTGEGIVWPYEDYVTQFHDVGTNPACGLLLAILKAHIYVLENPTTQR